MRRIQAFEFEDEAWFPRPLRDGITDFLQLAASTFGVFASIAPELARVIRETGAKRIVDLCSGGGGPILGVIDALERRHQLSVPAVLTDKYPNLDAFDAVVKAGGGRIEVIREEVDATAVPAHLTGVRTLFNALHHFPPDLARRLLEDAATKRQPICAFEVVERRPLAVAAIAGLALSAYALTPLQRPWRLSRFAMTYGLPLIPGLVLWDGMASCLRAYSEEELHELVAPIRASGYAFEVGRTTLPYLPVRITHLIGRPIC